MRDERQSVSTSKFAFRYVVNETQLVSNSLHNKNNQLFLILEIEHRMLSYCWILPNKLQWYMHKSSAKSYNCEFNFNIAFKFCFAFKSLLKTYDFCFEDPLLTSPNFSFNYFFKEDAIFSTLLVYHTDMATLCPLYNWWIRTSWLNIWDIKRFFSLLWSGWT